MKKMLAASALLLATSACGTMAFTPTEYSLRDGLVSSRPVVGKVTIGNTQTSAEPAVVYDYGGVKLATTLQAITQLMTDQTTKELGKAGQPQASDKAKKIDLKVTYAKSTYIAFYWKSELRYTATFGDGATLEKTVHHGTGGGVQQDLNGVVADAVVDLLNDPKVIAYLAE